MTLDLDAGFILDKLPTVPGVFLANWWLEPGWVLDAEFLRPEDLLILLLEDDSQGVEKVDSKAVPTLLGMVRGAEWLNFGLALVFGFWTIIFTVLFFNSALFKLRYLWTMSTLLIRIKEQMTSFLHNFKKVKFVYLYDN